MTTMRLSDRGLLEIAEHEGIVPAPYLDSVGVWTFGIGHTAGAGDPDPARLPKAMPEPGMHLLNAIDTAINLFRHDVQSYEQRVNAAIRVPLEQHEFDALVSWDFNTGGATFRSKSGRPARLISAVNAGDRQASRHFFGWLRPPEIRKRRAAERRLFETGDYDANGDEIPIWRTDGTGRLRGVISVMSGDDLLARMARPKRIAPRRRWLRFFRRAA